MNIKSVFESWSWSSWLQWLYWEAPILKKIGYKRALLESAKKKQSTKCLSVFFKFGLPWLQWSLQMADVSHQTLQNLKGILHLNISIAYQISYWANAMLSSIVYVARRLCSPFVTEYLTVHFHTVLKKVKQIWYSMPFSTEKWTLLCGTASHSHSRCGYEAVPQQSIYTKTK